MAGTTGQCMCGAVRFTLAEPPVRFGACHCEMCRRWTGSAFMDFDVPATGVTWQGEAQIRALQSSEKAERTWCGRCGSTLYYRVRGGPHDGAYSISVGLLDDASDLDFEREIFVDTMTGCFAYAGDRPRLTESELKG